MLKLSDLNVSFSTYTLQNNIRLDVYTKQNSSLKIYFNILGGDAFTEDVSKKGLAHFMEHILTAGSNEYPSKDALALFLDEYGAMYGGVTTPERMTLWFSFPDAGDAVHGIRVLASILKSPLLNARIIENERKAVLTEISQMRSKIDTKMTYEHMAYVFQNTPYAYPVLGRPENVDAFTAVDIQEWIQKNMIGGNIGICISGDIQGDSVRDLIETHLGFISKSEIQRPLYPAPSISETYTKEPHTVPSLESHTYVRLSVRMPPFGTPENTALYIIQLILGSRRSSLLQKYLRYEKGLVYTASASFSAWSTGGLFTISFSCKKENLAEALVTIKEILYTHLPAALTPERISFEKDRFEKIAKSTFETSSDFISFGNSYTLYENQKTFDQKRAEIHAISAKDVASISKKLFSTEKWYMTYSTNGETLPFTVWWQ